MLTDAEKMILTNQAIIMSAISTILGLMETDQPLKANTMRKLLQEASDNTGLFVERNSDNSQRTDSPASGT